eukprot:TRINITY_DN79147_c0_g1_i1.p1 TRINITY_DN79147_c0_g1~~TRINITY_DN79147_c0_g1_i1.p1  ORF type:complete len:521 (-),score=75.48 TRINITY_DN79147_c0_g1_i1:159-1721(-)
MSCDLLREHLSRCLSGGDSQEASVSRSKSRRSQMVDFSDSIMQVAEVSSKEAKEESEREAEKCCEGSRKELIIALFVVPVLLPICSVCVIVVTSGHLEKACSNCAYFYVAILAPAIFLAAGRVITQSCLGETCSAIVTTTSWIFCAGLMSIPVAWACIAHLLHWVWLGMLLLALNIPVLWTTIRILRGAYSSEGDAKTCFFTFLFFVFGAVPVFTGFVLYYCTVVLNENGAGWMTLFSVLWLLVALAVKAIGTLLAARGAPAQKGLGAALFGFHVDNAISIFGLPIFMTSTQNALIYACSLWPVLILQHIRGISSVFQQLPKLFICAEDLHHHRLVICCEVIGLTLGRISSCVLFLGVRFWMPEVSPDEQLLIDNTNLISPTTTLQTMSLQEESSAAVAIVVALLGTLLGFICFAMLGNRTWWHAQSVAPEASDDSSAGIGGNTPCEQAETKGQIISGQAHQQLGVERKRTTVFSVASAYVNTFLPYLSAISTFNVLCPFLLILFAWNLDAEHSSCAGAS